MDKLQEFIKGCFIETTNLPKSISVKSIDIHSYNTSNGSEATGFLFLPDPEKPILKQELQNFRAAYKTAREKNRYMYPVYSTFAITTVIQKGEKLLENKQLFKLQLGYGVPRSIGGN